MILFGITVLVPWYFSHSQGPGYAMLRIFSWLFSWTYDLSQSADSCSSPSTFMSMTAVVSCVRFYLFGSFAVRYLSLLLAAFLVPSISTILFPHLLFISILSILFSDPRFIAESIWLFSIPELWRDFFVMLDLPFLCLELKHVFWVMQLGSKLFSDFCLELCALYHLPVLYFLD